MDMCPGPDTGIEASGDDIGHAVVNHQVEDTTALAGGGRCWLGSKAWAAKLRR